MSIQTIDGIDGKRLTPTPDEEGDDSIMMILRVA